MVRNLLCLIITIIVLAGCVSVHETKHITEQPPCEKPKQVLRHVVLFRFKGSVTNRQVREIENIFCALPGKVDAIYDFEWGTDVSVENLSQGFTHCFIVTFLSESDRAKYLPHPAHKEFGSILGPHLDKALVVDFWTKQ